VEAGNRSRAAAVVESLNSARSKPCPLIAELQT
jgi:hypothetical protein